MAGKRWYVPVPSCTGPGGGTFTGLQCRKCRKISAPDQRGNTPDCCPHCKNGDQQPVESPVRCPKCRRIKCVKDGPDGTKICGHCHLQFEPVDDGDIGYGSPDWRLRRNERKL